MDKIDEFDQRWDKSDWEVYWKPLLQTDGVFDEEKIKNEMHDLVFIFEQISKVYYEITGGQLSKPMYYADLVIRAHEDECTRQYDLGYEEGREEC